MRDALGPIYANPTFAAFFSYTGRPAEAPAQLAFMTIRQFAEGLSDAQAADGVRARIDWTYALALGMTDPGFEADDPDARYGKKRETEGRVTRCMAPKPVTTRHST